MSVMPFSKNSAFSKISCFLFHLCKKKYVQHFLTWKVYLHNFSCVSHVKIKRKWTFLVKISGYKICSYFQGSRKSRKFKITNIFWILPLRFLLNFLVRKIKKSGNFKKKSVILYPTFKQLPWLFQPLYFRWTILDEDFRIITRRLVSTVTFVQTKSLKEPLRRLP